MVPGTLVGRKILVVEDEFLVAELMCARLARAGAILVAPTDRSEVALDSIAGEQIHGAVLDFMLADGTCLVVARKLQTEGIPFVIVTGLPLSELPPELQKVPYLGKPIDPVEFIEVASLTFDA
jgi:CheY-like chemotaxis protein